MNESPEQTPWITSQEIPSTTRRRTSKVYARNATTLKRVKKQDSSQAIDLLMNEYKIRWGQHAGKRVLYIPDGVSPETVAELYKLLGK